MMRLPLATFAVLAALLLVACGGDGDSSSGDYGAQLNEACNELQTNLARVSVEAKEQGTSASAVSDKYLSEFREQVGALEPPADREQDAEALTEQLDSLSKRGLPPDEAAAYYEDLRSIYADLGADDCAEQQTAVIETLKQVGGGLFETGSQGG